MVNSRQKGKRGERELSALLRENGFSDARRSQQYSGEGDSAADVLGLPGVHIECKRVESLNIYKAIEQAKRDCKGDNVPMVFHRKDRQNWLVTMEFEEFIEIYKECCKFHF